MSTYFILHTLQKSNDDFKFLYHHLVSTFLGIIWYRLCNMTVYNILHGKIQLLEGNMTKTRKSTIPVPTAAMFIYNNGHVLPSFAIHTVQFWITASYMSGSWNFLCSNECCPTEQLMVLSKREKQIKYEPFPYVLVHNNKGNNCHLSGHEVRKHSGSRIYTLGSCSSANN